MKRAHSVRYQPVRTFRNRGRAIPVEALDGLSLVSLEEEVRSAPGGARATRRLRLVRVQQGGSSFASGESLEAFRMARPSDAGKLSNPGLSLEADSIDNPPSGRARRRPTEAIPEGQSRRPDETPKERPAQSARQAGKRHPAYRKLFAEPGIRRRIAFQALRGEIELPCGAFGQQQPDGAVDCWIQVYEARRPMIASRLAAAELGEGKRHTELRPLTRNRASALGLGKVFRTPSHPFETQASTRLIYPGQRLYRIQPVPTPSVPNKKGSNPRHEADRQGQNIGRFAAPPQPPARPEPFQYSREKVIQDMKAVLGTLPPRSGRIANWLFVYPIRLLKTLFTLLSGTGRIRRWRSRLVGKDPDQQLWSVAPPRGFTYHPAVRRWVLEALSQSSQASNIQQALLEWEIFWRRRGWR